MEKGEPIEKIFKGIVDGESIYQIIYPPGFCQRCGYKLQKREDEATVCLNCGKMSGESDVKRQDS